MDYLTSKERIAGRQKRSSAEVIHLLEKNYDMDLNLAEKIVESYFSEGFLPLYYFLSNGPGEIAAHVFIITQILSANTDHIMHESRDGKVLTYFVNVGRDFPGQLARIIEENLLMKIVSFDSVKAASGIRIVTMEQAGRIETAAGDEEREQIERLRTELLRGGEYAAQFIASLPPNYMNEEISIIRAQSRAKRHLAMYTRAMREGGTVVSVEKAEAGPENLGMGREVRVSAAVKDPDPLFVLKVLRVFEEREINIHRSYMDTFESPDTRERVMILSLYIAQEIDAETLAAAVKAVNGSRDAAAVQAGEYLGREIEDLVRMISDPRTGTAASARLIDRLREMATENGDTSAPGELNNFLLNSITDFFAAARFIGIDRNDGVLRRLLRFESLGEFYVTSRNGEKKENLPGYRFAHNSARGPHKGGLRLDPIVRFDEVCALSFMMTWKTARAKILFGGAKGGLLISPGSYYDRKLDFIDTVANYGRSLFLLTGPMRDVPAGDVGCGPEEIGVLFEGFKSALRDLVLVSYGIKKGVTLIGNRVVSIDEARDLLRDNFDVDWTDRSLLRELIVNERYLELVAAPQITGKPRMGIEARTGATGRGLLYSVLAMTGRLYLEGRWAPAEPLIKDEETLLWKAGSFSEAALLEGRAEMVDDREWDLLLKKVYPKLLRDKKVIVQGTGKVGGSLLNELKPFGVNLVGVADAGGAVSGDHLSIDEVLRETATSKGRTCIGAKINVTGIIRGSAEGAAVLEEECDILFPCALENVINAGVARRLKARMVASGGNGTTTSKGETVLHERGIAVLYDFLANGGGVIASYFEWLRNLTEARRYETEVIHWKSFDIGSLDRCIMPEYRGRIKAILAEGESPEATARWNAVLRDIMFSSVNGDFDTAARFRVPVKTAGFADAVLRVLAAMMAGMDRGELHALWHGFSGTTKGFLKPYLSHPEIMLLATDYESLQTLLNETNP